jgi:hypothetical protein
VAGDKTFAHQPFEVGLAGLGHGHGSFQLGDGLFDGVDLGLAAGGLKVKLGQLGVDVLPFGVELGLGGDVQRHLGTG